MPKMDNDISYFIDAFNHLNRPRLRFNAPQSIQIDQIESYLNLFGCPYRKTDFFDIIYALDEVYFSQYAADQKKHMDRAKNDKGRTKIA